MLVLLMVLSLGCGTILADYWSDRLDIIQDEAKRYLGSNIQLEDELELNLNRIIKEIKKNELDEGFKHPAEFGPAKHFFDAKNGLRQSKLFQIIKKMPKAAALHVHDTALMNPKWIVSNVTYRDNLYANIKPDDSIQFLFCDSPPNDDWKTVESIRKSYENVKKFDHWLTSKFTLEAQNPDAVYKDSNTMWTAFQNIFITITPLLTYEEVFKDYMYEVLKTFHDDGVAYIEMRSTLPTLYNLSGKHMDEVWTAGVMKDVSDRYVNDYHDILGMKLIYAPSRKVNRDTLKEYLNIYQKIKKKYDNFLVGFDLVGQEDLGEPLVNFVPELLPHKDDINFYFHAGETNWNGLSTDENLIDAILLNTKRIGHGYAIVKHPRIMEEIKKRNIAVEINPISNQVLMLVKDLRNHPASILMANNIPMVISSDDPGFWGAEGISDDFYLAFMAIAHADTDLKLLKEWIINSIYYSEISEKEREKLYVNWLIKWAKFLKSYA